MFYLGFIRKTAMFGVIAVLLSSMMFGFGFAALREHAADGSFFGAFCIYCLVSCLLWPLCLLLQYVYIRKHYEIGGGLDTALLGIIAVDLAAPAVGLAALCRDIIRGRLVIDEGFAGRLEEFLKVVLEVNWCAAELIFIGYGLVRISELTR